MTCSREWCSGAGQLYDPNYVIEAAALIPLAVGWKKACHRAPKGLREAALEALSQRMLCSSEAPSLHVAAAVPYLQMRLETHLCVLCRGAVPGERTTSAVQQ